MHALVRGCTRVVAGGVRAGARVSDGGRQEFRCFWKKELRAFHAATDHFDGISNLKFRFVGRRELNARVTVFTVDLLPAEDPAAEKQERIDSVLQPSAETMTLYITKLKEAYASGSTAAVGTGVAAKLEGDPNTKK